VLEKRVFYMEISTPQGNVLSEVQGKAASSSISRDKVSYTFEYNVPATFDGVGTNVISFKYVIGANKEAIKLENYDSKIGELFEDTVLLNFTVISELYMVDIKSKPETTTFKYGNTYTYRFRIKDQRSTKIVKAGFNPSATVYLSLLHTEEGRSKSYVSARIAAVVPRDSKTKDEFEISWSINPNAVKGTGTLLISVLDADGNNVDVYKEGSAKQPVKYTVTIGGDIEKKHNTYSTELRDTRETVFVVDFLLLCEGKRLEDAQLKANVLYLSPTGEKKNIIYNSCGCW